MARYKYIDTSPRFIAIDLKRQLLPGTFEHAVNHLLDHAIDLTRFDKRFRNDVTGALAYPPALLLKVVLVAYAHGIVSSRAIEAACREHVTFIALCGDTAPHFTTIADFVSTLGEDIAHVFGAVVAICDDEGLISHEMFAIDGVKLPGNASKGRSGTRADMEHHATKLETMARGIVERHRAADALPVEPTLAFKEGKRIARLERDATQLREWLAAHPDERRGPKLLADQYQGAKRDCGPCAQRAQCLRTPEKTPVRQVAFFHGSDPAAPETHTARMQARIDTPEGRAQYAERFGAVEPVFANLRFNKGLDRFTLRGRGKVDGQWKLFYLVQNIEKLAHFGYAT